MKPDANPLPRLPDLSETERGVFRLAMFRDGLWDIFMGMVFLTLSMYEVTRARLGPVPNVLVIMGIVGSLGVGLHLLKRSVVVPRLGLVKLGPGQQRTTRKLHFASVALVSVTFVIWFLAANGALPEPAWSSMPAWFSALHMDLLFSLMFVGLFAAGAWMLGIPRLHAYGWLLGVGTFASAALDLYGGYRFHAPMAVAALVMLVTGIVLLCRFIDDHRLPPSSVLEV